jgi:hypothetical protein
MSTPPPPESGFDPSSVVASFSATWRRVMTDPGGFFAEMPQTGGLNDPLLFLAVCAVLDAVGHMIVGLSVTALIGAFVLKVVAAFVLAALLTLLAQQLFEGKAGFEPMFRVVAYAAAPAVLAWIPRLGVLAALYSWFLTMRGVERVQGFDAIRAVLTVAIGVAVLLLVGSALAGGLRVAA